MEPQSKPHAILLIFGGGGHHEQMRRLHSNLLKTKVSKFQFVGLSEEGATLSTLQNNFHVPPLRDKFSLTKSIFLFPYNFMKTLVQVFRIRSRFNILAVVSTGPGIVILPSLILKILGTQIIFLESWSRFTTCSLSGRFMSRMTHLFIVQHRTLTPLYPSSQYGGLL
jgi:UDP-N-acetylglucosamine:LPS N-acetylglucosamine transferase